jgi:hypothetical protein
MQSKFEVSNIITSSPVAFSMVPCDPKWYQFWRVCEVCNKVTRTKITYPRFHSRIEFLQCLSVYLQQWLYDLNFLLRDDESSCTMIILHSIRIGSIDFHPPCDRSVQYNNVAISFLEIIPTAVPAMTAFQLYFDSGVCSNFAKMS